MTLLTIFPEVHRWIEASYLVDLVAPSANDKTGLGRIVGAAQQEIAPRYNDLDQKDSQDMLGSFIRHGLTQEEAESNSVLQMSVELHLLPKAPADSTIHSMAGSDTSATVIRALFLYLITSPLVLAKLRSEIDDAIRDGRISSPIRDSEARQLPYLQACIREALRIHPPATGILEKVVPPEGDTVNGVFIPGGAFIGCVVSWRISSVASQTALRLPIPLLSLRLSLGLRLTDWHRQCTWALGQNVNIYGSDVELFRPERWLEAQGEELRRMERNVDLVFSSGRFQCLGKPVALLELNKVFVEVP